METKTEIYVTPVNGNEIIVREGKALEVKPLKRLTIIGTLVTVYAFLSCRLSQIIAETSRIEFSHQKREITLFLNECDPDISHEITGRLLLDEDFQAFGINTGKKYTLIDLSNFIKMHRYCFEDNSVAMKLVSELRNFKAKVNTEMEKVKDTRGNSRILLDQTVDSNIPAAFTLSMPIFKGMPKSTFNCEISIIVRDAEMECTLESVEANDIIKTTSKQLIDDELKKIVTIAPKIVQIEL